MIKPLETLDAVFSNWAIFSEDFNKMFSVKVPLVDSFILVPTAQTREGFASKTKGKKRSFRHLCDSNCTLLILLFKARIDATYHTLPKEMPINLV